MKKIFIFIVLLTLVVVNLPYAINFYKNKLGENLYNNKKYELAEINFPRTKEGFYNKGNSLYKQGKYKKAISYYLALGTGNNKLAYFANHNIGNAYYRLGEKENNFKIQYWEKAVEAYKQAIKIGEKINIDKKNLQQTKDNLDFVLKKMKSEERNKKKQGQNKQDKNNKNGQEQQGNQQKNNNGKNQGKNGDKTNSGGQNKNGKNNKDSSSKGQQQGQNGEKKDSKTNNGQGKLGENKQNSNKDLNGQKNIGNNHKESSKNHNLSSNNQKSDIEKALEAYEKQLQKEQLQNMQNYNKKYQPKSNNPFDDPFFDDDPFLMGLPQERNDVKDW